MAFDPFSAGAALIPSVFQAISGIGQRRRGRRLAESNIRPTYSRPSEVGQSLALAEQSYLNPNMPGASGFENAISAAAASNLDNIVQSSGSGGDILDGITKLDFNQGQQLNQLARQKAQYKQQQLGAYQDALATGAQYADKEFAYNEDQPYRETAAEASALIGAGSQNLGNAINGGASVLTSVLQNRNKKANVPGMFDGADYDIPKPFNYTNKKMVFDPYGKSITSSY